MNTRRAFTLVEMLTVIVIISILAALVTLAVAGAMRAGKRSRIAVEMNGITLALEMYKNEFGEYPPDFFDDAALVRHVKKRWPRFEFHAPTSGISDVTAYQADCIRQAITNVYTNEIVYTPAIRQEWLGHPSTIDIRLNRNTYTNLAALCVWLGGFPDKEGKFLGFSADPEAPFGRRGSNSEVNNGQGGIASGSLSDIVIDTYDKKNMMELTVNKNVYFGGGNVAVPCIVAHISAEEVIPFVYFRGKTDGGMDAYLFRGANDVMLKYFDFSGTSLALLPAVSGWRELGFAVPYAKRGNPFANPRIDVEWCEPTKYQIIHPGLDLHFGNEGTTNNTGGDPFTRRWFRSLNAQAAENSLGQKDLDNLTNFSEGKELKSILP